LPPGAEHGCHSQHGCVVLLTAASRISPVNGSAGLIFQAGGTVVGVMGLTVASNLITEIDFVVNPEKLQWVTRCR
jgi:hypothetical protein